MQIFTNKNDDYYRLLHNLFQKIINNNVHIAK
jgi:hypothetical protein